MKKILTCFYLLSIIITFSLIGETDQLTEDSHTMTQSHSLENWFYCGPYCADCRDRKCFGCDKGWYLKGRTCERCRVDCDDCVDGTSCLRCKMGYHIYVQGLCEPCPIDGCLECLDGGQCIRCAPGFFFDSRVKGNCLRCNKGCQQCDINQTCTKCFGSYNRNGAFCEYVPFWRKWFFWVVLAYCLVFLAGVVLWWVLKFFGSSRPTRNRGIDRNTRYSRNSRYEMSRHRDDRNSVYSRRSVRNTGYRGSQYDTGYINKKTDRRVVREVVQPVAQRTTYGNQPVTTTTTTTNNGFGSGPLLMDINQR